MEDISPRNVRQKFVLKIIFFFSMPSSSLTAYVILNCFLGFTYSPQTIYVSILNYFVIFLSLCLFTNSFLPFLYLSCTLLLLTLLLCGPS